MTMFGSQWLANAGSTYEIDQSIRFNAADSPYLTKTFGADGGDTWTFSLWIKRSEITSGGNWYFFSEAGGSGIGFVDSTDKLRFYNASAVVDSTQVFRDVTAWYHFVFSNNAGTVTITVNNTAVEIGSTTATLFNRNNAWYIGSYSDEGNNFEGYMAEMHWVDGTALAPTDFGEYNTSGVWIPKAYTGSYGTNGFYITGEDSSDLGADYSGNGNDFTSSGLAAADQMPDTPTNNQSVFNVLDQKGTGNIGTFSEGNLTLVTSSNDSLAATSIPVIESGCYWEAKIDNAGDEMFGLWVSSTASPRSDSTSSPHTNAASCVIRVADNKVFNEGSGSSFSPATISTNDVVMFAYKDGQLFYGKNDSWENSGDPGAETGELFTIASSSSKVIVPVFGRSGGANVTYTLHMSEEDFTYTPPTGFVALSTANLPTPAIADGSEYFHTQLYTGTGSSGLEITNDANAGDFKPDWFWVSPRSNGDNDIAIDVARGVTSRLKVNGSDAQDTDGTALFTFETDGFHVDSTDVNFNGDGRTYVAWQWKTQGGAGSSNTDGSINTTTTSVNTTAGFSISTYTGTGANATVGHGLGLVPKMIILKNRADDVAWVVYHVEAGNTHGLALNDTGARADDATFFNDTTPTSTVFSIGSSNGTNGDGDAMVAYCFAEIPGYSRFGKFEGNANANGPFIHLGFKPAWFMWKNMDSGTNGDWTIMDSKRDPFNMVEENLRANSNSTADTGEADLDFCAAGVKHRGGVSNRFNAASTYIYMAFAEHPFGGDGVAPATAR